MSSTAPGTILATAVGRGGRRPPSGWPSSCWPRACGGSKATTTTAGGVTTTTAARRAASATAYRNCLAKHGVTLPTGGFRGGGGGPGSAAGSSGVGRRPPRAATVRADGRRWARAAPVGSATTPSSQAAQKACASLRPKGRLRRAGRRGRELGLPGLRQLHESHGITHGSAGRASATSGSTATSSAPPTSTSTRRLARLPGRLAVCKALLPAGSTGRFGGGTSSRRPRPRREPPTSRSSLPPTRFRSIAERPRGDRPMKRIRIVNVVLVVAALLAGIAIWTHRSTPRRRPSRPPSPSPPRRAPSCASVSASGTVQSAGTLDLNFQNSGTLIEVDVVPGQKVQTGQVLAKIDPTTAQQAARRSPRPSWPRPRPSWPRPRPAARRPRRRRGLGRRRRHRLVGGSSRPEPTGRSPEPGPGRSGPARSVTTQLLNGYEQQLAAARPDAGRRRSSPTPSAGCVTSPVGLSCPTLSVNVSTAQQAVDTAQSAVASQQAVVSNDQLKVNADHGRRGRRRQRPAPRSARGRRDHDRPPAPAQPASSAASVAQAQASGRQRPEQR